MKYKKLLTLILASFFIPFLTITSLHATVFFEFDGESGYQYMGSGSSHPGGGYFSQMGGIISGIECPTTCPSSYDTQNTCHNTRLSEEGGVHYVR